MNQVKFLEHSRKEKQRDYSFIFSLIMGNRKHNLLKGCIALLLAFVVFTAFIIRPPSAISHVSSEYNADKVIPFSEAVYEINPQTGTMSIGAQDFVLKGRAGQDLVIGRIYSNVLANAYNMGVRNLYAVTSPQDPS